MPSLSISYKQSLHADVSYLHFSGRVDSQIQITGSILQPNVSGMIKLSNGEASLPQDKGSGEASKRLASNRLSTGTGRCNLDACFMACFTYFFQHIP